MYDKRTLHFLWNISQFCGHTQHLEVNTTPKENMLFHDNGAVVFRLALSRGESTNSGD